MRALPNPRLPARAFLTHLLICLSLCFLAWTGPGLRAQTTPPSALGDWRTFGDDGVKARGIVRFTEENGVLTGRILRSLVPGEDPNKLCSKCTDERKDKLLRGMAIITGMRFVDGAYSGGEILDPDSGGIYRSTMSLSADGRRLTVRGYIGIPLFGRTQGWIRAE